MKMERSYNVRLTRTHARTRPGTSTCVGKINEIVCERIDGTTCQVARAEPLNTLRPLHVMDGLSADSNLHGLIARIQSA